MRQQVTLGRPPFCVTPELGTLQKLNFTGIPLRSFKARKVTILNAATGKPLKVKISGFNTDFEGVRIVCMNVDNPENLDVDIEGARQVSQGEVGIKVLFVEGGQISITGLKKSNLTADIDTEAETLARVDTRDPDIVRINGSEYHQTGSVYASGDMYYVLLEG
jgi:hypothetical protein